MSIVIPAVLPSSKKDFEEKLALFAQFPSVRRIQIDIVDGRFATPASWPYTAPTEFKTMVAANKMLPQLDRIEYEIDLMCFDVESAAGVWLTLGAARLTFHAESARDVPRMFASARERYGDDGVVCFGLALNITSDLAIIEQNIGYIQYVQFMGIDRIGRQGQPFDLNVFEKVRIFHSRHPGFPIQVDGGITLESAKKLIALGVTNLVIGSSILKASDPAASLAAIEALSIQYGV
ncbi:MAG: hypothetical protein Q8L52_04005 [bacterium]|nr:hypothetical protein [bacterium]